MCSRQPPCLALAEAPISQTIHGDLTKLKPSQIKTLERLTRRRVGSNELISLELATQLTLTSEELGRVVALLVDRRGRAQHVMVGDSERVYLPDLGRQRAGASRFRGVRLLRTHLKPGQQIALSSDDLNDLTQLQLDAVVSVGVGPGGYPGPVTWAHLVPENPEGHIWEVAQLGALRELSVDFDAFISELEGEFQRKASRSQATEGSPAMLVYVATPKARREEVELGEMVELCRTAGVKLVDTMVQRRQELHAQYAIGRGKLEDLTQRALQLGADLLIFGQDLTPGQLRSITGETSLRVIDRTQLILDIFAQHATSRDGRVQVELAQLRYNLPRLSDRHTGMSRLTGGIGGRGPGETKLEINRRRARDRIRQLEHEIVELGQQRALRRQQRQRAGVAVVAIVGYTNAGKSTLLNALTHSDVLSEDMLFATLRPTSRKLWRPEREVIFTDTVGFIHDLPADLVAAFKATLEELAEADLLLHVVDISDDDYESRMSSVQRILKQLGVAQTEQLLVFNKSDQVEPEVGRGLAMVYDAEVVSALDRQTLEPLLKRIDEALTRQGLARRAAAPTEA